MDWQDISTAPRNGLAIEVMHEEAGSFIMAWNKSATNELFAPGQVGLWESLDGGFTWRDDDDLGPTHWRHIGTPPPTEDTE